MKTKITKNEYLQIQGLLTIAQQAQRKVDEAEKAYIELVDYPQEFGGCDSGLFGDAIWEGKTADSVLKNEGIEVEEDNTDPNHD